jgi:hypothetical protein
MLGIFKGCSLIQISLLVPVSIGGYLLSSHSISILCTLQVLIIDLMDYQEDLVKMEMMKKLDFEDWIDQLHRFMHQINIVAPHTPLISCILTLTLSTDFSEEDIKYMDKNIDSYNLFPRSTQARLDDQCLLKVFKWLQDLI